MNQITNDLELCKFDGVSVTTVYTGGFNSLVKADIEWRKEHCEYMGDIECLRLSEIIEQLPYAPIITVFVDSPLSGQILQYGNYGDSWYEIGETCGYA